MNQFLLQDRDEAEEAKQKSSGLFDPSAEAFQGSFKVTISLLAVAIVAGLIWHFGWYKKKQKRKQTELNEMGEFMLYISYFFIFSSILKTFISEF